MTAYLDRPPSGWLVVVACKKTARKWDWAALMIDAPPTHAHKTWDREAWVSHIGQAQKLPRPHARPLRQQWRLGTEPRGMNL